MGHKVQEDDLLKAIADIDNQLAKGEGDTRIDGQPSMPQTTAQANGALGQEGDTTQLAAKSNAALDAYVAKSMDDDEDDDAKDDDDDDMDKSARSAKAMDDDDDEDDAKPWKKKARKSESSLSLLKSQLQEGEADLMPFLESLTDQVSESQDALGKSMRNMRGEQRDFNETLAKAVAASCRMTMAIKKSLDTLMAQPNGQRKSYLSKSEVSQRFVGGSGAGGEAPQYSRADITRALVELTAAKSINGLAVTTFEQSSYLDPVVRQAVENHLQKSA